MKARRMNMYKLLHIMGMVVLSLLLVTSLLEFQSVSVAPGVATYYVSPSGNDSNKVLETSAPFKTFEKALQSAGPGDTVMALGGVYSEKIRINKSGSVGAPITLRNMPGEYPILDGSNLSPRGGEGMITLMDQSNIVIDGFEIRRFKASGSGVPMGIYVEGVCANVQILNCKIHEIENPRGNAHGIAVYGNNGSRPVTNLLISGNEIFNCKLGQSESLVLNGNVDGFKVINNVIHDNDNIGIDFIGYEGTANANDYARNGECVGNLVYNISSLGNPTYSDASAGGIYVDGGANILIDRNIVKNCDIGIEVATEQGPMVRNITVTNNLITDCKPQAGISFGSASDARGGGVENLLIANNTLYNNRNAIQILQADSATNLVKHNIMYGGRAIQGNMRRNVFENNITEDPHFVNGVIGDFTLKATSPAIDVGGKGYGSVDLAGNPRVVGAGVDAGAYEYLGRAVVSQEISVIVRNENIHFDSRSGRPFIDSQSRTLVPFRAVLEAYGCQVEWDAQERMAVASLGNTVVRVPIGQSYILVNGRRVANDTTAQIKEGRTYIPIRAVLEAFGAKVSWDANTRTVTIQ